MQFCNERKIDPFLPTVALTLEFLLKEFRNSGKTRGYSAMNTIRSAISSVASIDGTPVGQHVLIRRFMKAVFREKPALPRYHTTWDPDIVLNHLKSLGENEELKLLQITKKLTILLLLLSGQRCQTIHCLDINSLTIESSKAEFKILDLLKTSRPGHHLSKVTFNAYEPDRRICVVTTLNHYLARTKNLRGNTTKLLVTSKPPIRAASRDTVQRWTRDVMQAAGINTHYFKPYSTRHASTSKAAKQLPLQTLIDTVGWKNQSTFAKYYKKPITQDYQFSDAILINHDSI